MASDAGGLRRRFPALARLERSGRRRPIPFVRQMSVADCGAASLAMVLSHFGADIALEDIRARLGNGRDGVNARQILDGARLSGLRGRAVRVALEDLEHLPRASILHWRMNHFVVLEEVVSGGIRIVDPAVGRYDVAHKALAEAFTGVALTFEPVATMAANGQRQPGLWRFIRTQVSHAPQLSRILVLSVLAQFLGLALPLFTRAVVDRVIPRSDVDLLAVIVAGTVAIGCFGFLASLLRFQLLLHLRTNLDVRMTLNFVEHLMRLPFPYFQTRHVGDLMMRLNSHVIIREKLTSAGLTAVLDGMLVFAYLVLLLSIHLGLGLVVALLGALRVLVYALSQNRHRELMSKSLQAQAESAGYQVQMLSGVETLKAAGAESHAVEHWSHLFTDVLNVSLERGRLDAVVQSSLGGLGTVSPLILLAVGAHLVLSAGMSLGTMLAMTALAVGFLQPLTSLVSRALELGQLRSYVDRVVDVLDQPAEQAAQGLRLAPPLGGRIELKDVSFRYAKNAPLVVANVSCLIEKGQTVAVVGRSGSGKSTLARLIVGLVAPVSGGILYDDRKLAGYDLPSFRRQFGYVPQDPYLFATSLRHNITLNRPDLSLSNAEDAARAACIHEDIMAMPLKYDTVVAASGSTLSGGQRQRIALARALAGGPPALVLDESTSHLDALTEARVNANIGRLPCTRLIVAHRLSTIANADLVLVMEAGQVVERGTHTELLANDGAYARLVRGQMEGVFLARNATRDNQEAS